MTSVLSSTRQIPLATTFYQIPSGFSNFYELSPSSTSSGNYPGTMVGVTLTGTLTSAIARDMGKTVKATITGQTTPSFFREVQLLVPNPVASPDQSGVIGMLTGSTYGLYATYYVVVPISGFSSGLALSGFMPLAGGQM
jgi:hypothetical protein